MRVWGRMLNRPPEIPNGLKFDGSGRQVKLAPKKQEADSVPVSAKFADLVPPEEPRVASSRVTDRNTIAVVQGLNDPDIVDLFALKKPRGHGSQANALVRVFAKSRLVDHLSNSLECEPKSGIAAQRSARWGCRILLLLARGVPGLERSRLAAQRRTAFGDLESTRRPATFEMRDWTTTPRSFNRLQG